MLNSLKFTIKLNQSVIFLKCSLVLYGLVFVIIYQTHWLLTLKLLVFIVSGVHLIKIAKSKSPYSKEMELVYQNKEWSLKEGNDNPLVFTEMRFILENNLFLFVELKKNKKRRKMVIFRDQLDLNSYRSLKLSVL